jgi:hemoglobin/transferrin/lactoferrin receptor protein
MLKQIITIVAISGGISFGHAQSITVIDKSTLENLPLVTILLADSSKITTDNKGVFEYAQVQKSTKITINHPGYERLSIATNELTSHKTIYLTEASYCTEEVVFTASKFEEKQKEVPQQSMIIKSRDMEYMNAQNSGDVLQQTGNIFVQKSQLGGGSPIIRGYEANKVLMVVDGVRMNNAIYRGGHLQNIITLDNNMLERVEVIYGPGAVIYGSDALGGVMHFRTKNPKLSNVETLQSSGGSFYRFSTANKEESYHFNLQLSHKNIASLTSFTNSNFGDLRSGANYNTIYGNWGKRLLYAQRINGKDSLITNSSPNLQVGTSYDQQDFLQKILVQTGNVTHIANLQFSTSSNINRYDRLTDQKGAGLKSSEWYYGPQNRLFSSYTLEYAPKNNTFFDKVRLIYAFQNIDESRISRNFGSPNRDTRIENVKVNAINLDFNKIIRKHEFRYGAERITNIVTSTANRFNISSGATTILDTRYPDGGSKMNSVGIYLSHAIELAKQFIITEGIRFSNYELNAKFNSIAGFNFPFAAIRQQASAINGNIGFIFQPGKDWRFSTLGSSGFRAPNVDDISKVFESTGGNLIVPNPNLKPEYNYNVELSISKVFFNKIKLDFTGYNTWVVNAITTGPAQFNGLDSILYNGAMSKVSSNKNSVNALITGYSAGISADITNFLSFTSSLNYTYGRIETDTTDYPLDHIAPLFGRTSVIVKVKRFKGELWALYNDAKKSKDYNLLGEDNQVYSANTTYGFTPGWITYNLRGAYHFNDQLQLQVALDNILDTHYRLFASGISAPGRNVSVTLRAHF